MTHVIAEISNQHEGNLERAKELILAAKAAGAWAVKGQAIARGSGDMRAYGMMPEKFYDQCAFSFDQYRELITFGEENSIPVFFSVISSSLRNLRRYQPYQKLWASDTDQCDSRRLGRFDREKCFISMTQPKLNYRLSRLPTILYASRYQLDVDIEGYEAMVKYYDRPIGISHHAKSHDNLTKLARAYHIPVIEKHFHLAGCQVLYDKILYRDCIHAYGPKKFSELVKELS